LFLHIVWWYSKLSVLVDFLGLVRVSTPVEAAGQIWVLLRHLSRRSLLVVSVLRLDSAVADSRELLRTEIHFAHSFHLPVPSVSCPCPVFGRRQEVFRSGL
jgi:hypothetical protein